MPLFNTKNLSYLGVDLGSAGVKIVELKNENGRPRLVTYGYADMSAVFNQDNWQDKEDKMAELIKKICVESKTTTKKMVAALPNFSVFTSVISLPKMSKSELDQAVVWEAKKFVPLPIEEMNLYSEVIEVSEKINKKNDFDHDESENDDNNKELLGGHSSKKEKNGNMKVLVVAAPKKNVVRFVNLFKKAELDLINLETESFALERALVGNEEAPVMIVDIGAISADITIVDKGIPVLNRSVDMGGSTITKRIAKNINVDFKRAEQFKRDIGFSCQGDVQGVPKIIQESIEPIVNEIKYCFDLYLSQEENKTVEKIILTGGSSFLPNLPQYLSSLLNIKVIIGDPWARVIYPIELKPVLDEIGPKFSVAIGLAMREIE